MINLRKIFAPAIEAIKLYGLPFAIIQLGAVIVVVSYYNSQTFREWCVIIARWKVEGGLFFAAWTTSVCSSIFPEILKSLTGRARRLITDVSRLKDIVFNLFFFATMGIFSTTLYRVLGLWLGYENNFFIIATKVFIDQFIWNPFFNAPYCVFVFLWREKHFNPITTFRAFNFTIYKERVLPLLFPTWLYWTPMVSCIYSMPEHLQFPLYLCVQTAWSLLFIFILKSGGETKTA